MFRGFTLLELCIAITISAIAFSGLISLYCFVENHASRQTDLLAQVQQLHQTSQILSQHLAQAGKTSCLTLGELVASSSSSLPFPIEGKWRIFDSKDSQLSYLFSHQKKLLPDSQIVAANIISLETSRITKNTKQQYFLHDPISLQQDDWVILNNCTQAVIARINHVIKQQQQVAITLNTTLPENFSLPASINKFSSTLWFTMENDESQLHHKIYGLYEWNLLNQSPPVELLSHVVLFHAEALAFTHGQWQSEGNPANNQALKIHLATDVRGITLTQHIVI